MTAGLVLAVGLTVLLGWTLHIRTMQSFYPGWVTMKANTAFALTLGGASLLLHATAASGSRIRLTAARVLGGMVAVIGAATGIEYLTGRDLGIDQLLFLANEPASATPGRMAAVTAFAFVLIGTALALAQTRTRAGRQPAQPFALAAGAVGLAAVLGFTYGAISTVGKGHGIQIAIHTAISIVLLSAGLFALQARNGWLQTVLSPNAGGQLARRLLPLAFVVPVALGGLQSLAEWAGIDNLLDGAGIVAVLTMLAFGAVIWRTARAIDETEARSRAAENERVTMAARAEASRESEAVERAARETAEKAAREKDEALTLLNLVLDSSPVGFALFDRDLRVRRVNRAFTDMTGAHVDDHFTWALDEVMPELAQDIGNALRKVLETGAPVINLERTVTGRAGDRSHHWLSSKYPVRSREGEVIGVGMTLVETTERKELEAQLQQGQKMKAVGQLAGGVAHDFNNVLTAIKSFGELVASDLPADSAMQDDVREIITAADRGTALTSQLLAFSRQQRFEPTVVNLTAVANGVTKLLSRLIGTHVRCETSLSPSVGCVLADPGQLEQVIVNLALNARDAMPSGGTLRIETRNARLSASDAARISSEARAGDYVTLSITDTGEGMDEATQRRIFDPFFTTKAVGKGTGLGLSTVYGIVTQSAGYIKVDSAIGRGTTFTVYFPRVDAAAEVAARPDAATPVAPASETVLLVDDDEAVRKVLTRVLSSAGFSVLPAASPEEAETIVSEHAGMIHLVMTDLMMPGMNGDELAQRIRAKRPETRVLYTSGYTGEAVAQRGLIRPEDPFLSKPFTIEAVVAKVREALAPAESTKAA